MVFTMIPKNKRISRSDQVDPDPDIINFITNSNEQRFSKTYASAKEQNKQRSRTYRYLQRQAINNIEVHVRHTITLILERKAI